MVMVWRDHLSLERLSEKDDVRVTLKNRKVYSYSVVLFVNVIFYKMARIKLRRQNSRTALRSFSISYAVIMLLCVDYV